MDYIKSWYEYFRGNTTNRSKENITEDVKNEILRYGGNHTSVPDVNPRRTEAYFPENILNVFFKDADGHPNESEIMSGRDGQFSFGGDMFHFAREMHKEFLNFVNGINNEFSDMQSFIFEDISDQNLGDCMNCDKPNRDESLRDYYLTVPPLVTPSSENNVNVDVIIPGNDGNKLINDVDSPQNSVMPHFHQTQQIVSVSVGPDGVLQVTKIIKDSSGKTEKTITKMNLKDKM